MAIIRSKSNEMGTTKILTISGDPGGSRAILPVVRSLIQLGFCVNNVCYSAAIQVFQSAELPIISIYDNPESDQIEQLFNELQPDLLLAGTSMHEYALEKRLIKIANRHLIPSLSILDFWSNYRLRFFDSRQQHDGIPTKIAIMDDLAFNQMVAEGFKKERLVITGQPAFDGIINQKQTLSIQNKPSGQLKNLKGKILTFFSQPIAKYYHNNQNNQVLNYDENTVIQSIIAALPVIEKEMNAACTLFIIPHPTQKVDSFEKYQAENIVVVNSQENVEKIIAGSDLIIGMTSSRLYESWLLGLKVLSLQPETSSPFVFPTTPPNKIPIATSQSNMVTQILTQLTEDQQAYSSPLLPELDGQATDRVVRQILNLLAQNKLEDQA